MSYACKSSDQLNLSYYLFIEEEYTCMECEPPRLSHLHSYTLSFASMQEGGSSASII